MTAPNSTAAGCAAPDQSAPIPAGVDLEKETVITGILTTADGDAVGGAYVRLLDSTGEFTAARSTTLNASSVTDAGARRASAIRIS